jgi:hypothetical protein
MACPSCFFERVARTLEHYTGKDLCRWCDERRDWLRVNTACRALAAGLLGVCWGMAFDWVDLKARPGQADAVTRIDERLWGRLHDDAVLWLLDQSRPPGCRAPWKDAPKETP